VNTRLIQLQQRVRQLEVLAQDIGPLAERYYRDEWPVDDELSLKGQRWYRGSRELLAQHESSSLKEFEECYRSTDDSYFDLEPVLSAKNRRSIGMPLEEFQRGFRKARALVQALEHELLSRELPVVTQLSFSVAADELEKAEMLLRENSNHEVIVRASGVIGRVALERHLWTVVESRGITVTRNPPSKRKPEVSDLLNTMVRENVITPIQRSQLDSLFSVANNCAHPKEAIRVEDVERLIREGRSLASVIL
jgi:hypothetical protein